MPRLKYLVMCLILASRGSIRAAVAQTTAGSILGDVSDSSGAKLPGVAVTARNQENGALRETVTDALGSYNFSALPPGTYTVSAALSGFGTVERKDVRGVELRGKLAAMQRDVSIYSTFVNDMWRPRNNLTLNLGVRYDFQFWRGDLNGQDTPTDLTTEQFWVSQIVGPLRGTSTTIRTIRARRRASPQRASPPASGSCVRRSTPSRASSA